MGQLWAKLSNHGVSEENNFSENKRIRLSNQASIVSSVLTCIGAIIYFFQQEYLIGLVLFSTAPFYSLSIILNRTRHTLKVRFVQVLSGQLILFVVADWLGPEAGIQYIYIPLLGIPFALFDFKQKFIIALLSISIISLWFILESINYSIIATQNIFTDYQFIKNVNILIAMLLMIAVMYGLVSSNNNAEIRLNNSVTELAEKENQLLIQNKQLRDASDDLIKNEKKLNAAIVAAENAAHAKANFLSNMSHEIRTPLNAVIGITDYLLDNGALGSMEKDNLDTIKYSADNLLVIVNDILDFSKIDSGNISLENTSFDLYKLIHDVTKTLHFKAAEKGLIIHNEVDRGVPHKVVGDPYRINQILLNLAGNAIKFTKAGQITLNINIQKEDDDSILLQFEVRDTGIGIPKDKINQIFQKFFQATESTTRRYGGTGLGLAISKGLVELMEGEIAVKSEVNQGSCFYFTIPLKKCKKVVSPRQEPSLSTTVDKNINGVKVLLVEDYKMNQIVAINFLELWGAQVTVANNGEEALQHTYNDKFDVILMDIQMPIMDGYEATINIKMNIMNPNQKTPIIALTANAFNATREKATRCGMTDFIPKPFNKDILFEKILNALLKARTEEVKIS